MRDHLRAVAAAVGGFPDTYLVADTETTGIDPNMEDVFITQVGYLKVEGGEVTEKYSSALNYDGIFDDSYVSKCLDTVRWAMSLKGSVYHITLDMMREGPRVRDGLHDFADLIQSYHESGLYVVGHNFAAFDAPMVAAGLRRFCDTDYTPDTNMIIDTGMIEKSRRVGVEPFRPLSEFWRQTSRVPSRAKWNLSNHCVAEYGLEPPGEKAHDSLTDCITTYNLIERMKELAS